MSLPSELFQENVYHEVYFWKSNRLLPLTFTKVNSIVVVVREFSESFEAIIKSRLSAFITLPRISFLIESFLAKLGCCSAFFLKMNSAVVVSGEFYKIFRITFSRNISNDSFQT